MAEGETHQDAEDRGFAAGLIEARLRAHDDHFLRINGNIDRLADEVHKLNLGTQRLGDEASAAAKTVVTTAAALKAADDARRTVSDTAWTPFSRFLAALAGVAVVAGLLIQFTSR